MEKEDVVYMCVCVYVCVYVCVCVCVCVHARICEGMGKEREKMLSDNRRRSQKVSKPFKFII